MDIDIALAKINADFYYHHAGDYASLEMLDGNAKPSLLELNEAWMRWLNGEGKAATLRGLNQQAEAERLKYISPGDGNMMKYQQQQRELSLWLAGERAIDKFPICSRVAVANGISIEQQMAIWDSNISAWLQIGGAIEANLIRMKLELAAMNATEQADFDDFLAQADFYRSLL